MDPRSVTGLVAGDDEPVAGGVQLPRVVGLEASQRNLPRLPCRGRQHLHPRGTSGLGDDPATIGGDGAAIAIADADARGAVGGAQVDLILATFARECALLFEENAAA